MADIVHLIRAQATSRDADCLMFLPQGEAPSKNWSYRAMWALVSNLAASLQQLAAASCRVAVMIEEGPDLAFLELAVLVAGMIIVPIDPSQPADRLALMIADIEPSLLVTTTNRMVSVRACLQQLQGQEGVCKQAILTSIEQITSKNSASSSTPALPSPAVLRPVTLTLTDISHIFFTSGSTGRPKGCICTHGALVAYCQAKNQAHKVDSSSVVFMASALSFDPSLGDFLSTWLAGAKLVVATKAAAFTSLGQCLHRAAATHVLSTPTMFSTINLSPSELPALRVVALGGEAMSRKIVEQWANKVTLANTYGVTECCVYQTFAVVTGESDSRKLGSPLPGNSYFVVAGDGEDPSLLVSPGSDEQGELWLAGPQVGVGYWKRSRLTAKKFVIHSEYGPCFRTGDVVRAAPGGWELVGRWDSQVKIRGQRVELGEIDQVMLSAFGSVLAEVAVVLHEDLLVAYFVLVRGNHSASDSVLLADVLRRICTTKLPVHMVPSRYLAVDEFPRTATGKLNRSELTTRPLPDVLLNDSENNEEEKGGWFALVSRVWTEELGVKCGAQTHFFEMGGESLGALRVCRKLQAHRANETKSGEFGELLGFLSPAELMKRPRLADYAAFLSQSSDSPFEVSKSVPPAATVIEDNGMNELLARSAGQGNSSLVSLLLKHKAESWGSNKEAVSPMHLACLNGQMEVAEVLLAAKASVGARDRHGITPLHLASHKGPESLIQLLLQAKASLSAVDGSQQTVLHHAARAAAPSRVFAALLDLWERDVTTTKASNNSVDHFRDEWGRTPLHWAVVNGHRTLVALLLEHGANPKIKDRADESSLEIAERRAQCGNTERPDAARASVWGDIAKLLGGSGKTRKVK